MSSPLTTARLLLRGLSSARGGLIALGIVMLVATAAVVAWPRLTTALLSSDLEYRVSASGAGTRDLQATFDGITLRQEPTPDNPAPVQLVAPTWKAMPDILAGERSRMPAALRSVTGQGRYVGRAIGSPAGIPVDSTPTDPPASVSYFAIEGNPELRSDAVLDAGEWPSKFTKFPSSAPVEVVVSTATSSMLHWKIGQSRTVTLSGGGAQAFVLVGTVHPREANTDYWSLDSERSRPGITHSTDLSTTYYYSLIWVDAASWPRLALPVGDQAISTWFPVDGRAFNVSNLTPVDSQVQRLLATPQNEQVDGQPQVLRYTTSLSTVLDDFVERAGPANTLLTIIATGPLGAALAVLLLGIRMFVDRRSASLALMRARGASRLRVRGGIAAETAVASVPAALAGGAFGYVLTAGSMNSVVIVSLVCCVLVPPLIAAIAVGTRLNEVGFSRRRRRTGRVWVLEVLVVALAVLGLVVLRQQGLTPPADPFSPDILLVVAPLLVSFATCVVVLRAYPYALRWLGVLFRRRRGAVGFLGWATSMRTRSGVLWPLFAVVTGVSIAVFSLAFLTTERVGVTSAAISEVGADVSVTATDIPASTIAKLRAVPGVAHAATVMNAGPVRLSNGTNGVELYLVNPADVASVESDTPGAHRPFAQLFTGSGTPVRVIAGGFAQAVPPKVTVSLNGHDFPVRLTALAHSPAGFITDQQWMVAPVSAVPAAARSGASTTTVVLSLDAGADPGRVHKAVAAIAGDDADVRDAAEAVSALRAAPIVSGVEGITFVALFLSALMCVAALVLTLVMRTSERARLLATLRTLGFSARQSVSLIAWELGPISAAGIVAGGVVGIILPIELLATVDLAKFTGGDNRPALEIDPILVVATLLGFAIAAAVATAIAMVFARRAAPASVLRERGEE